MPAVRSAAASLATHPLSSLSPQQVGVMPCTAKKRGL